MRDLHDPNNNFPFVGWLVLMVAGVAIITFASYARDFLGGCGQC